VPNESCPKTRDFSVIVERDSEGWHVAGVPELSGCHTQAKSLDKLMERIHEAIDLYLATKPLMLSGSPRCSCKDQEIENRGNRAAGYSCRPVFFVLVIIRHSVHN
jgi:predicted RNase H-like HicB family nuclease